ncbi:unnamed protein product [Triticum turgidum subsp. durum]|uniref:Centromere protein C n=1 Tax=Triticum turgidum subsp. durum TaxID=4567 RepID=A0A9R0RNP4_TRITD|nr:unnamed protein product [Triticum turgidum subsp. durum]
MASVDAAGDPLRSFASATSLLFRTLGPAAASTSPSRAPGALLGGSLVHSLRDPPLSNRRACACLLVWAHAVFDLTGDRGNPVNVDFSKALSIDDPEEYFLTLERLEKADREIKKLRGEVPTKTANYDRPMEPPKKRPGMSRRKSVYSYNFSVGTDASDGTEAPDSQMGTLPESQSTQDDMPPSVPERTKPPVPSSSSQCDIQDVSTREDSFAKKDKGATLDSLMSAFKNLDESKEESLLREKLQIKEINIGEACIPDLFNVPGDRPVRSTKQKYLRSDRTPERPVLGSHHAPISKWEKHILGRDILDDKADLSEDDESDNSPETVVDKQSQVHSSYNDVVLTNGEASTARETPTSSIKFPDHVLEPEEHMPVNHPFTERPNNEPGTSSHHLEGETTKVLGSAPDEPIHPPEIPPDAHNQSHIQDENVEKQAVDISRELPLSKGDKPIHTSEILPEDIVPQNNSHVHEGNFEKPAVGASNELSPSKDSKQKRVQNEESKKQPLKRMKRGAEEASNPLGIPPENCDTETQPSMQDTNIEQQTVDTRVPRSPNKAFGLAWQSGVRRSTRIRSRPLQDWLGERLLYGRIHDTMATVIGVKSYSPSQDGKVELRVKSFVPEQYSDMVAQAAKY